jgi:hypothetical protein
MNLRIAVGLLAAAGLIFACVDHPSSPQVSRPTGLHAQRFQGQGGRPRTIDEEFAEIASADSSFGGFYLDAVHAPVVYLTDTNRLAAVRAAGLDASLSMRKISAENIRVVHGAYGFGALKRWYDCAAPQVLALPNTILTDIDEAENRLHFGVAKSSAEEDVQAVVARCDIPSQAVIVDVVPQVRQLDALNESVRDSVRPLRGGIEIRAYHAGHSAGEGCSIGVIGRTSEGTFFITASHCSVTQAAVDTVQFWQPRLNTDSLGREEKDPSYFYHPDLGCPSNRSCRMSDANMIRLHSTATGQVGLIARTSNPSHNPSVPGDTTLDASL